MTVTLGESITMAKTKDAARRELKTLLEKRRRKLVGQLSNRSLDSTLICVTYEMLRTVDIALTCLETGTYGKCRDCGQRIANRRLEALPFALRCRRCEERREIALEADSRFRPGDNTAGLGSDREIS